MSKPLLGGSALAFVLLSASLTFNAQTSVAEPLTSASQNPLTQQKGDLPVADAPAAEPSESEAAATLETDGTAGTRALKSRRPSFSAREDINTPGPQVNAPEPPLAFVATAYSLRGRTASGRPVSRGVIAADSRVLPLGTRVRVEAGSYSGEYLVADTGGGVRGRKIDIWVSDAREAARFGRRPIKLTVLTRVRPRTATRPRAGH